MLNTYVDSNNFTKGLIIFSIGIHLYNLPIFTFFPNILHLFFSFLTTEARTSSAMFIRSGKSEHLSLFPISERNVSTFCHLNNICHLSKLMFTTVFKKYLSKIKGIPF